jgi:hypothetical protein
MNTVSPPRETSYQLVVGAKDGQRVDSRLLE